MPKSLLLVAHGSRHERSNDEIRRLTERLGEKARAHFPIVACAFLESARPDIGSGVEHCVQRGAREVLILPYFLASGRHVSRDLPHWVRAMQNRYPGVSLRLAAHVGAAGGVVDLLLATACQSPPGPGGAAGRERD